MIQLLNKHLRHSLALCLWLVISAAALGASNSYNSSWWMVDGGGGPNSGEAYVLDGTICPVRMMTPVELIAILVKRTSIRRAI